MAVEVSTNSLGGIRAVFRLESPGNTIVEISITPLESEGDLTGPQRIIEETELAMLLDIPRLVEGKFDQVADLLKHLYKRASSSPGRFITTIRIERDGGRPACQLEGVAEPDLRCKTALA
ncbi:MAG TPA: hypothetical protein VFV34_25205 [Blastocatellia bacterium]|nr:hypothetical protein [Blastocatellia bacterium]